MLNQNQKMTIRTAVKHAKEKGTEKEEIKKLARGMNVPELEILQALDVALDLSQTPTTASVPVQSESSARQKVVKNWTPEMERQLFNLKKQGKGPAEIAQIMGLDTRKVANKLYRMPKPKSGPKTSVAKEKSRGMPPEPKKAAPPLVMSETLQKLIDFAVASFGGKVVEMHASNDANTSEIVIETSGTRYKLSLEVIPCIP